MNNTVYNINKTSKNQLKKNSIWNQIFEYRLLYLFLIPSIVITFLFQYLPMFSNAIAFMDYDFRKGWMGLGSPFVGFKHFGFLTKPWFYQLLWRTFYYSFSILLFSFPASFILALLINEIRSDTFKKIAQSVFYVPHFVSWVTVASLFYIFFSYYETGIVNNISQALFGGERYVYMQDKNLFLPLLIISNVWKETGYGTLLYIATIATIDPQLYEAAIVDGANRWQRAKHITIPSLLPTTAIILIFALSGLVSSNFDQIFNFHNQAIQESTHTIDTFVFYRGVKSGQYSFTTAVALFRGLITLALMQLTNAASKKFADIGII